MDWGGKKLGPLNCGIVRPSWLFSVLFLKNKKVLFDKTGKLFWFYQSVVLRLN